MNRISVSILFAMLFSIAPFSGCGGGGEPPPPPPPPATLVSIAVSPPERSIAPETTTQFNAIGRFSNGSSRNINSQVRWQSSKSTIASIDNTGLATGVSRGQTSIIAVDKATGISSTDSGGNAVITVSPVVSIAVSPPSATIGEVGMSQQFIATATLEDGNSQNLTSFAVAWGSTTSAATISSTGLATPLTPGTADITASFSGVTSGTATLTVEALLSITVTPANAVIPPGLTQQFTATGSFSTVSPLVITKFVTWTSGDGNVATFSPTDPHGLATSVGAGATSIEASFNGVLGSTTLFIEALTSVLVSPANRSIFVDGDLQYTATGTLSGGGSINLTSFVSWDSSDTGVATINSAGLASAVSTGVTNIIARADFTPGTPPFPSGSTTLTVNLRSGTVEPLYATNGADWNDYVDNNRASVFGATGVACNPVTDGPGYRGCLHGGEMRMVEVSGKMSCTGLSAIDDLGAFDWFCDSSTNPVRMVSAALREEINLSDLIDFSVDPPVFKTNSVTVSDAGGPYLQTPSAVWWGNTVVKNNTGGTLTGAGQIYVMTNNTVLGGFTIGADKVAVVMSPDTTLADSISASGRDFLWIEGRINATAENAGVSLTNCSFSVIRHVRVSSADTGTDMAGILLDDSSKNLLVDILSANNDNYGLFLVNSSDNNSIWNFVSSNNGVDGVQLSGSSGNSLVRITAFNNGTSSTAGVGVQLADGSIDNTLFNVTAANNQVHGVAIENLSSNNLLSNVTAVSNGFNSLNGNGLFIGSSSVGMTVQNLTSANNSEYGVHISESANNVFTGLLQAGENGYSQNCKLTNSFVHPGVVDVSCTSTGSDGSNFYTGSPDSDAIFFSSFVDLTSSFAAKVTSNDSTNTSDDSSGRSNIVPSLDWTGFDNAFRGWGRDGAAFPIFDNRGRCTTDVDPCRIWDWSINSGDQIILAVNSLPTGNSTITHAFTGSSPTFLRNAAEIIADGFGDDDGLCESGEKCLFTPNMGSYQGEGPLKSAGGITSGTVSGVTLKERSTNGI